MAMEEGGDVTYTAELDVSGREVTVVGGSPDALGKISTLLSAGAHITVVSPEVATSIRDLAERGLITWLPRHAEAGDFRRSALVIAATDSRHTDAEVRTAAALENRLTVSAGAEHPTRPSAEPTSTPPEQTPPPSEPTAPAAEPSPSASPVSEAAGAGRVILVGGGPGDPGLLTVAGLEAIRTADVIVCDRLAPLAALDEARSDAQIIDVGKIPRGEYTPQERINALLVEHASRGRRVDCLL